MLFVKNCHRKAAMNPYRSATDIYYEVYSQVFEYLGLDHDQLSPDDELRKKTVIASLKAVNLAVPTIYRVKKTYKSPNIVDMEDFQIDAAENFIGEENACKWAGYAVEDDPSTRCLIFATNFTMNLLHKAKAIYVDGTFRMCPKLWKQVLIVNCELDDKLSVPVLFALLPDKRTLTYEAVFQKMKEFLAELNLSLTAVHSMADFEMALRTAWTNTFPDTPLKNCMFHYSKVRHYFNDCYDYKSQLLFLVFQAIISKVQELGLKPLYSNAKYEYLGRVIRGMLSLSLVPLDRVFEGYGLVTQYASQVDDEIKPRVEKLIKYYYNTWLTGMFKIETWNFFGSFMQRTNNVSEGFNHNFNESEEFNGTSADPNLWLLIKVMLKHLKRTQQKAEQMEVGQDPRHRRGAVNTHMHKENARHALMLKLTKGQIELPEYMNTVGKSNLLINNKKEYVPPNRPATNTDATETDTTTDNNSPAPSCSGNKQSGGKKVAMKTPDTDSGHTSSGKKPSGAKSGDELRLL